MIVGDRLRELRESKHLSQGDIQERTGLMRCYISRVENGHTVPAVETLYKFARALEVPMYRLFYDESGSPGSGHHPSFAKLDDDAARGQRHLAKFMEYLPSLSARNRNLLITMARKMVRKSRRPASKAGRKKGA